MHSGSYLTDGEGVRRFSPEEVGRLLHFPDDYTFPSGLGRRRRWHYLGNSLSVAAVRQVLSAFPELAAVDWGERPTRHLEVRNSSSSSQRP
jgi:DNA (cytosine-5)-methyltransferase 1/tRNA (cytosine38-C5)-methyltransferase